MPKFRKKPIVIEAQQFGAPPGVSDGDLFMGEYKVKIDRSTGPHQGMPYLEISTREGVMRADFQDWIITGISGERYPCKPDIFAATYEPVTES